MKITSLKRKIIITLTFAAILFTASVAGYVFSADHISKLIDKKNRIKSQTSQNESEASDVKNKTIEVKRYIGLWDKISDNKKNTNGIRMDEVNAMIDKKARKYSITDSDVSVTLPKEIKSGIFNRSTLTTQMTTVKIKFSSVNDIKALAFITEVIKSMPGYAILDGIRISKERSYEIIDLVNISTGKGKGLIKGEADLVWYVFKEKASIIEKREKEKKEREAKKAKEEEEAKKKDNKKEPEKEVKTE